MNKPSVNYGTLATGLLTVMNCKTTNFAIMQFYGQQINIKDNAVMLSPNEMQVNYAKSQRNVH